MRPATRKPSP
uniref:Uncharacterized protein n=1 Tax=Romanomermis culicivorax TaxID=13658 RepID=A0A915JN59_ROMCU